MTEQEKNKLARLNGYTDERYTDLVKEGVKKEMALEDEVAILRKAVNYLFELIAKLHEGELNNAEFAEYNTFVEAVKLRAKEAVYGI